LEDGAQRAFVFYKELKLALTAISITAPALFYLPTSMSVAAFFTQHPCCTTYFLPAVAKSK